MSKTGGWGRRGGWGVAARIRLRTSHRGKATIPAIRPNGKLGAARPEMANRPAAFFTFCRSALFEEVGEGVVGHAVVLPLTGARRLALRLARRGLVWRPWALRRGWTRRVGARQYGRPRGRSRALRGLVLRSLAGWPGNHAHDGFRLRAASIARRVVARGLIASCAVVRGVFVRFEREPDPVARLVQADNGEFPHVAYLDRFHGVTHELVRKLGDMDQRAFLDADVDKGAEIDDVLHLARDLHALLEVGEVEDALREYGRRQVFAGVAVGFLQFDDDVVEGGVAHRVFFAQGFALLVVGIGSSLDELEYFRREGVVFGVNPGVVELVVAFRDLEEAGALLEGFFAQAGNLGQHVAGGDGALIFPEFDDLFGEPHVDARYVLEDGMAGGVEVDAHLVDDGADDLVQLFGQLFLVDVVLVEADADAFGIDLDEFGEGVLEASADRDGAPDGEVEVGEFLPGEVGGRIDGGTVLVDGGELAAEAIFFDRGGDGGLHFVAGGAVSDGDDLDIVLLHRGSDGLLGFLELHLLVDDEIVEEFARLVEGGALGAGAYAGVDAENPGAPQRRRHEEILQVFGEDVDGVGFGVLGGVGFDFPDDGGRKESREAILDGFGVVGVVDEGFVLEKDRGTFLVHIDGDVEGRFAFGAVDGEHAVAFQRGEGFGIVPVHLIGGFFAGGLVADALRDELACLFVPGFYGGAHFDILGNAFGEDVLGAGDGILGAGDRQFGVLGIGADEAGRRRVHGSPVLGQHDFGEGREAFFLGEHATGLFLFLVGRPEVVEFGEGRCLENVRVERFVEFAEGGYALGNFDPALLEVLITLEFMDAVADLYLVEASRHFLAVAADEGHRGTFGRQRDDG